MTKHIGIVVCSAEGAALCYRTICAMVLDTSVRTPPRFRCIRLRLPNTWRVLTAVIFEGIGNLMLSSALCSRSLTMRHGRRCPTGDNQATSSVALIAVADRLTAIDRARALGRLARL